MASTADELCHLVARVPQGWTSATYDGRRWGLSRRDRAGGRVIAVFAEELGGRRIVSANVYRTCRGELLKPCEMPAATVLAFLRGWRRS